MPDPTTIPAIITVEEPPFHMADRVLYTLDNGQTVPVDDYGQVDWICIWPPHQRDAVIASAAASPDTYWARGKSNEDRLWVEGWNDTQP
jgi:hypothetical protein